MPERTQPDALEAGPTDDGKQWVREQLASIRFMPEAVRDQYFALVGLVVIANPELSPRAAYERIWSLETEFGHRLYQVEYADHPAPRLVTERRRLAMLEALRLLPADERSTLDDLRARFSQAILAVKAVTGDDPKLIQEQLDSTILYGVAKNLTEAQTILTEGPIIEGFETTTDPCLPNAAILTFLFKGCIHAAGAPNRKGWPSGEERLLPDVSKHTGQSAH